MNEVAFLPAIELLDLYRTRELSPVEATEAALRQIEDHNPRVNAYCFVDTESALAAARESEARYGKGAQVGKLDGVPASIKDVFLTRGWPTLKGSRTVEPDQAWEEDAPATARLRENGAILLGKTTTPEFGWKGVTDSPLTGITGNPWAPSLTPGGSSGGSAAAVALGMGRLTVGTDGGGSIRIPSAFSGLVGLKPTYGRVPWWPPSPYGTVAHAGPMASTVADAALMLDVITEPDARDPLALPAEDNVDYLEAIEGGVEGLRIAFSPDFGYVDVDSEVERPVRDAVRAFEELGAQVEEVDPSFEDPVHIFKVHWYAAAANILRAFGDADRDLIDPGFVEVAEEGSRYSALEYLEAVDFRNELRLRTSEFHETYDLLLSPTLPIGAFEAGREVPEGWPHRRWTSWAPFSYPFNLTQQPAASVPCGFTGSGLPVGLQIVGGRYQDALVLRAAHAYQTTHSLTEQRPSFSGGEGRGQ